MPRLVPIKYVSSALLVIMLLITVAGVCKSACASEAVSLRDGISASCQVSPYSDSGSHDCPCSPFEDGDKSDAPHSCCNCICHLSLAVVPFRLAYHPVVADLVTIDPLTALPDVYLSKFIPPQNLL